MIEAALYLIPVPLSEGPFHRVLTAHNVEIVKEIRHYVVENVRSARRFLKKCDPGINIDSLTFCELNRHTDPADIESYLEPLAAGEPVGVISEAGCPAVADPGADVVAIAQRRGFRVVPLVGPSSILLGLMASGFNGQSFVFHGYLPIDAQARARKLRDMQQSIMRENQTQIFIETPYRNDSLFTELSRVLPPQIRLCVATDITGPNERIITRTIAQWVRAGEKPGKVPTIFLLYK